MTGIRRAARTGVWLLSARPRSPGDLDGQICEIFEELTDDMKAWRSLSAVFDGEISCGLFLKGPNEGIDLPAKTVRAIGERGLGLGFDIYGGVEYDG